MVFILNVFSSSNTMLLHIYISFSTKLFIIQLQKGVSLMKKKILILLLILIIPSITIITLSKQLRTVAVTRVMDATFSCPNTELFDPETISFIGIDAAPSSDSDLRKNATIQKWEEKVGVFFTEEGFENFINRNEYDRYHVYAYFNDVTITIGKIKLLKNNTQYNCTIYLTLVDDNGIKKEAAVTCNITFQGLKIQDIKNINDSELWN